ncbi:MAG: glycosyltransferase family 4 protein [Actinomycetia bacterium]|nr:glycosyltransferase family 4 protein [Actinomycetes bacterium]
MHLDAACLLDVTDFVEFLTREESVSGVQRVVAELTPRLSQSHPVVLDRGRGVFVALNPPEVALLSQQGFDRASTATQAQQILERARTATPQVINTETVLVFLGALWISDALMLAARNAHAHGARLVVYLYDLTPVLDANHTAAVNRLFERYLSIAGQLATRVPAISQSSRNDFTQYCEQFNWEVPPGQVTKLPPGVTPQGEPSAESPWPRPYALFVGTIEGRKNHLLALNAWRELAQDPNYSESLPDLVCIGRLGWNANEFLTEYVTSSGLHGKVSVLDSGLSDAELGRFYEHAEFTVYPSKYEGWGLPVSESIAFAKLAVVANNSSLPEAGDDLAVYFESEKLESFITALKEHALNLNARTRWETTITSRAHENVTWEQVAAIIESEITQANAAEPRSVMPPEVELGHEYALGNQLIPPNSALTEHREHADQFLDHFTREGLSPLLHQQPHAQDMHVVDSALVGEFGSPQTWGYELRPGKVVTLRITRPTNTAITAHFATRSMPGVASVSAAGPGGPVHEELYLGSVLSLPLGAGKAGEQAAVTFHVTDATDSVEGFVGLRSLLILESNDTTAEVIIHKAAAQALRAELDFMTNTRSWKVTEPLRKWKGRGSS